MFGLSSAQILDIVVIAIFAVCIIYGYTKGFVRAVYGLFSSIISYIVSCIFARDFSIVIAQTPIFKSVSGSLYESLDGIEFASGGAVATNEIVTDSTAELFERIGFSLDEINRYVTSLVSQGVDNVTDGVKEYVIEPVLNTFAYSIAFLIIFIGALLVLKVVCFLLDKTMSFSGLAGVNKFFGVVLGVLAALVYSMVFCLLAVAIIPYLATNGVDISIKSIDETHLFKIIHGIIS